MNHIETYIYKDLYECKCVWDVVLHPDPYSPMNIPYIELNHLTTHWERKRIWHNCQMPKIRIFSISNVEGIVVLPAPTYPWKTEKLKVVEHQDAKENRGHLVNIYWHHINRSLHYKKKNKKDGSVNFVLVEYEIKS